MIRGVLLSQSVVFVNLLMRSNPWGGCFYFVEFKDLNPANSKGICYVLRFVCSETADVGAKQGSKTRRVLRVPPSAPK